MVFVLAFSSVAFGFTDNECALDAMVESGAWETADWDPEHQLQNVNNPNLRFYHSDGSRDEGVIVIPSRQPGIYASEDSAILDEDFGEDNPVSVLEAPGQVD